MYTHASSREEIIVMLVSADAGYLDAGLRNPHVDELLVIILKC